MARQFDRGVTSRQALVKLFVGDTNWRYPVDAQDQSPLSALIAAHETKRTDQTYADFLDAFMDSKLGVNAVGVPPGVAGEVVSTAQHPVSLGMTGQSAPFILAYADPVAFRARWGNRFNAEMWGETLLTCALHRADCQGVWVNSALTEKALIIGREKIISLMYNRKLTHSPIRRPWWRWW